MATGLTTNFSIPYPLSTDPVDVAGDIQQLSEDIDNNLTEWVQDISSLMWTTGGTFGNGLQAPTYNDSTGKMSMSLTQDLQTTASPTFVGITLSGDIAVNGGDITTSQTTFNLINATTTTLNIGQAATTISMGATSGTTEVRNDLSVASGKVFKVDGTAVLSSSTLGSGVTASSLTSVGTISSGVWGGTEIAADKGGTGQTSFAIGDILYASTTTAISKLADVATGNALISGGVATAPSWGKIDLTTHISGTLAVGNGGTGVTSSTGTTSLVLSDSPTFTGTPVAPTAAVDTNTTQIATTAFVINQGYASLASVLVTSPVSFPYTITLLDAGHIIEMDSASANDLVIPLNSSVAFPIGSTIDVIQIGAGQTSITFADPSIILQSSGGKLKLTGQYSAASLYKRATDTWAIMGDLSA